MKSLDNKTIAALREDYRSATLLEAEAAANPIEQFKAWFEAALQAQLPEPNAMTLATANTAGIPNARIVLLKGVDERGFVFYTNYGSAKGQELTENPRAVLVFVWLELQRQVRVSGRVERVSKAESEAYFQSRPKGSQIGAYVSPQSEVIDSRQFLDDRLAALNDTYKDVEQLPLPDFWGGFRLIPENIEFWQGRSSRLHDRLRYSQQADLSWKIERLAP